MSSVFASPTQSYHRLEVLVESEAQLVDLVKAKGQQAKHRGHNHLRQKPKGRKLTRRDDPRVKPNPIRSKDHSSRSCSTDEGPRKLSFRQKAKALSKECQAEASNDYQQKFKTEMCKNYEMQGYCRWGEGCSYAHGHSELRKKTHLNTNYRSKICKLFHKQGGCPYGLR